MTTDQAASEAVASAAQNSKTTPKVPTMPSAIVGRVGFFDRFAGGASTLASRAPFFAACVLLIVVWAPSVVLFSFDTWQLIINTATTIVTFLMVALLQNSQTRNDQATQHKLNALADGLADLMAAQSRRHGDAGLDQDLRELRLAVGLEDRETTGRQRS
jgi:low affinity Fe/Cu permease